MINCVLPFETNTNAQKYQRNYIASVFHGPSQTKEERKIFFLFFAAGYLQCIGTAQKCWNRFDLDGCSKYRNYLPEQYRCKHEN